MTAEAGYPHVARPLLVMRLAGSQAEMGAQHGRLLRAHGGYEEILAFYPGMPARTLASADRRPLVQAAIALCKPALDAVLGGLERQRPRAYRDRSRAFFEALGAPARDDRYLMVVDLLQNIVGLAARWGLTSTARSVAHAMPGACSSVVAWAEATDDGRLLHARNFDLPGIGVWDRAPAVVMCAPDAGLRYGFVTARGADVPAVSAFNEAGLTITAHTRFHRDVGFRGAAVVDIAHDVVRRAETLADAVAIVRERRSASSWGLLVSSARERGALAIEVTAAGVEATAARPGEAWLAETNRYRPGPLAKGEVAPSEEWLWYSDGRAACLRRAMKRRGGWSVEDLQALLGSYESPDVPGWERATGAVLGQSISIQSVVCDPERERICVSVGTAPTGRGPWVEVPWRWDRAPASETIAAPPLAPHASPYRSGDGGRAYAYYMDAARLHATGEPLDAVSAALDRAVALTPDDPSYLTLAGGLALARGDAAAASDLLERAYVRERSAFRRARLRPWLDRSRASVASGRPWRERVSVDFQLLSIHT